MDEQTRQAVTQRLASAAGHLRAIERMAHEDVCCLDMLRQIQAVQAALRKVSVKMLDAHLHTCVVRAVRGANAAERERMLQEVMAVFELSHKLNLPYPRGDIPYPRGGIRNMTTKTFTIPNISCGHCTHTIEVEVGELAGVKSVRADQDTKQVTVVWEEPATWEQIVTLLQEINYPPNGLIQIN